MEIGNGKSTNPSFQENGIIKNTKSKAPSSSNDTDRNIGKKIKGFRFISKILQSIKMKLIIGLLIPIILLAIYGFLSYKRSENALINNYETSTMNTIDAISKYMNMGLNMIERSSLEIVSDFNFKEFFKLSYQDAMDKTKMYDDTYNRISINASSNTFISAIHLIGKNGLGMSTASTGINDNLYEGIVKSNIGQEFKEKKAQFLWISDHSELDELMMKEGNAYKKDTYATSIFRKMIDGNGFIIVDVSTQQIRNIFSDYDLGEGSILGFITPDGRETLNNPDMENVFVDLPYYQDAIQAEEPNGFSYENYNGISYLFIYSKLKDVNATVCALIPKSTILKEVNSVKALSVAFVTIASIIAIIIVILIAGGISRAINSLNRSISQASQGDLTAKFETKRNDEFAAVSNGISNMMKHMRTLIGDVQLVSSTVSSSAVELTNTAGELLEATKGISETINDIGRGIVDQADDTEHCLHQMTNLSDHINQLYHNTNEIGQIANNTQAVANEGMHIIDELSSKSKATALITHDVIQKIMEFDEKSKKIEGFVNIINGIAEQTNLLSLNASIEAARAGDAGRGFAVVAEEIRKLADQSMKEANEIKNTVKGIKAQNMETVETAKKAENIVASQTEALSHTVNVFENISKHVNELVHNMNDILSRLKTIESAKEDTLNAIQNISAVTEETAASSEEVNATTENQIASVERLQDAAIALEKEAERLENAIKVFKINET